VRLTVGLLAEGHDAARWASYHGNFDSTMQTVELDCRCSKLTKQGFCGVQENKPKMCLDAIVGGPSCVHAIGRNRPELRSRLMMLLQTHA
jgi:hypothetical protein